MSKDSQIPVAVVTGGASGIGAACCATLARQRWQVVVADIDEARGREVAAEIGGQFVRMDVGDEAQVDAAAEQIFAEIGEVRGVITSAGVIQAPSAPEEMSMQEWDRVVRIDQRGTYVTCLSFGRRMAARGNGGSIVNIASIAGSRSMPLPAYVPAKAAVISMSANFAVAWGGSGLRVNSLSPGYTLTPGLEHEIDAGRRDVSRLTDNAAMGRLVAPAEIASAAAFLLSDAASAITGIDLPVDCGWLAGCSWNTYGGIPARRQNAPR